MAQLADIFISVAAVLAVTIVLFLFRRRRMLRFFKNFGIPGPKPEFIWGNMKQMACNRIATLTEWKKQYGTLFGIYFGSDPFLVITDPDMVHDCFVKQAAIFQDRPKGLVDAEPFKSSLLQHNGSSWKSVRSPLNYAFNSSVIKELSAAANVCCSRFVDTAARISRTHGRVEVFESALGLAFDFIMNAVLAQECFSDVHQRSAKRVRHLDDRYIFSNAAIFLLAGFETTASALSFLLYLLASHPSEQNEIMNELEDLFPEKVGQDLSFEDLRQLKRLDLIILEGLRMYPPVAVVVTRKCSQDTTTCGRFIPAGVSILAVPWLIHHDPDLWPDPEQFRPERFAEENRERIRSGMYVPFGLGRRVRIGEKLALLLVKCALVKVLQDFRLTLCDEVASPLAVSDRGLALIPEGLRIRLERRVRDP
ncbi:cytochrome P450 3A8-like [Amblyomma americanum]